MRNRIFPFLSWLPQLEKKSIRADFFAGLTGAIIVLPQGVAFAMIAGMPPVYGLYTAIVLPIVAALFGSSRHLISGPTTAISLVVFAAISEMAEPGSVTYIELVLVLTFLTGAFQLLLGLVRLGTVVNFVSHTVVLGFTAGAALLIIISQVTGLMGIPKSPHVSFFHNVIYIANSISQLNPVSFGIGIFTFLVAFFVKKIQKSLPNMLIAMILGSIAAWFFTEAGYSIRLVGEIPSNLPPFTGFHFEGMPFDKLIPNAFTVALLGLIEAVAIARSIGARSGQIIDANQEFIGQGLSNIIGSMFSSYAGSGSFTRSGVNYDAGARSPLSGIFAALFLAIILIFMAPLAAYIPISAMGGIILLVGINLIDFHHIKIIFKSSKRESTVLLITFLSTLILDLEFAILLGVIFSLIFYLQRTSHPRFVTLSPDPIDSKRKFLNVKKHNIKECPQLKIIRMEGSLFFGAAEHASHEFANARRGFETHLLLIGNGINLIDTSGAELLVREANLWKEKGGGFYISGLKKRARDSIDRGHFKNEIGVQNFFPDKESAIKGIYDLLDKKECENCKVKVFLECNK
ncbi:MAG: SulP family inorganic anion transporter [Cyclobacteriaceae bacterium]|nr:SulP family inorganic anion transporter [Cyclobacteriaceae bacterium]